MKNLIVIISACFLFLTEPVFAQSSQTTSARSSSIFTPDEGKATKKKKQVKRSKKSYKASSQGRKKTGLFAKKGKSDCDCPGSPKAKKKRSRSRR